MSAWLVVMNQGGLFGIYLDWHRANEAARNIGGVLIELPISKDFR